jgi:nucleoid-associated protein YgaU
MSTEISYFYYALLSGQMPPDYNPAEAGEIFSRNFESSAAVDGRVGSELSQNSDVHAARDFFQGNTGHTALPDLQIDVGFGGESAVGNTSSFGIESSVGAPVSKITGVESAAMQPSLVPGVESAAMQPGLIPGLESGALAGIPPGGEPISPLVQMILKMPGLTGVVGDFFSALMAFFFPADGGLMSLLDPALWASVAQQAFTSVSTFVMHDFPLTLTTMGSNNPFQSLLQNGMLETGSKAATASPATLSLEHQSIGMQPYDVGGMTSPGSAAYEMTSVDNSQLMNGSSANIDLTSNKFIAMEGGNSFGPTLGGTSVPTAQMPNGQTPTFTQTPTSYQSPAGNNASMSTVEQPLTDRGSLLQNNTASSGTEFTSKTPMPSHHVVESGDNLWNIAKEHLGSGARWTEVYELNKNLVGTNPDLIFKGTDLKLPGAENVASGTDSYVVQPGDNLWNISRDHLGGGQNWHSIYDQNAQVIGSNPDLIHPGQNLAISNGGTNMQVAHSAPTSHAGGHATTHATTTANHSPANHTPAHQPTAHNSYVTRHAQTAHGSTTHNPTPVNKPIDAAQITHHSKTAASTPTETPPLAKSVATSNPPSAEQVDAGIKTEELGKTAHNLVDLKQEIGLKAVAKAL